MQFFLGNIVTRRQTIMTLPRVLHTQTNFSLKQLS